MRVSDFDRAKKWGPLSICLKRSQTTDYLAIVQRALCHRLKYRQRELMRHRRRELVRHHRRLVMPSWQRANASKLAPHCNQVKGSMVFNDDFLEEEYANLPTYQGTEILAVRRV